MTKGQDAIGFRMAYRNLVLSGALKTIFRPDNDKYQELYSTGSLVEGRIIKRPGCSAEGILPIMTDDQVILRVKSCNRVRIEDLTYVDFLESSPDVKTQLALGFHLALIYNEDKGTFSPDKWVVRIVVEYVEINRGTEK